ncbi:MAG: hypothetical protein LBP72_07355 [Dysgonamonadaceae bacterium]|jgi:predicted RNA-binding Zn-ribbon protein involved in translation (DUF1610 family)|nr:hypothetical protein [Dysgonamonadaceae bacterium]
MKEVTIIMATCQKSKRTFGIRAEKINGEWHFTWAFPIDAKAAGREGYDATTVKGIIVIDAEYPGCPHCGDGGFVHCGQCRKIVCYDGMNPRFKCPVCGNEGELTTAKEFDSIKGGEY